MNNLELFNKTSLKNLLTTKNENLAEFEDIVTKSEYSSFREILLAHDIVLNKIDEREKALDKKLVEINEYIKITSECDKWDYIFAVSSGVLAGLIDSFFVGMPSDSKMLSSADGVMNTLVENFAKLNGWEGAKNGSDPTKSAIGFLERAFKVNYDQRHSTDVAGIFSMSASNHHLKSLAHSPSPIGLIFSIIDQFNSTSTFLDNGYLITIDSESKLQGSNFVSKIFAAFMNWIGHIMSDIAGSSGASARGSGVPIPFYELLLSCNIGSFGNDKKTLAEIAVKVFEQGYDFRFGMVQAIPVLMSELFVRIFCIIRHRFQYKRSWDECLNFVKLDSNPKVRKMLLAAHGTLCLIDAGDAFLRSSTQGFNWVTFFARVNFVAWMRLSYLGVRHTVALLRNEIELERYKLRAQEFDNYVSDVTQLADEFLIEHNRKMETFLLEHRTKLNALFNELEKAANNREYLAMSNTVKSIGNMHGFSSKMESFEEFDALIDDDEY
ncbi:Uncharacterised protein [Canicola haemoglobinophilus]|uniref:Uncharacterized protein n=1 Tax=Canicola haemoglobinophilus TaxID=733 RepID=A0AB38HBK7_9PAST|nr:hypothetical protein [Canicola haemoglobinophilus]STO55086.1 Uncharacterised protein [Canicola haemoglobinophilus]STO69343.1 Uncharacterised protein [Canicola haemoglobinophilus]